MLTESLTSGSRKGVAITLGLSKGVLIHILAAATGLSFIIQQSAMAFIIIKYLGAAYMFYLAYKAIRENRPPMKTSGEKNKTKKSLFQHYRKGFLMNVLNPKVSLFFIAFLPQFVSSQSNLNITWQMIILGIVFMLQTIVIFSLIAMLSGKLSSYLNSPKFWKITKWSKVSVLSLLGLVLVMAKK